MTKEQYCPGEFECNGSLVSFDIGAAPSYIAIISSLLSILGSLLILAAYAQLRDMRTIAQTIITLLAIADLVTAAGYVVGSVNFLVHFNKDHGCDDFFIVCEVQASVTSWSSISSFLWTVILAFHFCVVMVYNKTSVAGALLPVYNIIAWGVPLLVIVPLAALRKLGYAPYVASNWCFVKDENYSARLSNSGLTIGIIFLAGKLWEFLMYIIVTTIYIMISMHMMKTRRRARTDPSLTLHTVHMEKRLLCIPLLLILLRMWGTLQFFYSLAVSGTNHDGCIPHAVQTIFVILGILQAVGDPGQGWGNTILYIFLSPTIRQRLFSDPWNKCISVTEEKIGGLLESESGSTYSRRSRARRLFGSTKQTEDENEPLATAAGYKIRRYTTTTEASMTSPTDDYSDHDTSCYEDQYTHLPSGTKSRGD